jgi:hypothetical protein
MLLSELVLASSGKSKTCGIVDLKEKLPKINLESDSAPRSHLCLGPDRKFRGFR